MSLGSLASLALSSSTNVPKLLSNVTTDDEVDKGTTNVSDA